MEVKDLSKADETRKFEKEHLKLVKVGGSLIGRAMLQPGWRWSTSVKPIAKTKSCQTPQFQYQVSGTMHVVMDNGTEVDCRPGDVTPIPLGHDAWIVGREPVVVVDFQGFADYAKVE